MKFPHDNKKKHKEKHGPDCGNVKLFFVVCCVVHSMLGLMRIYLMHAYLGALQSINCTINCCIITYIHTQYTHTTQKQKKYHQKHWYSTHPSLPEIHNCTLLREGDFN